MAARAAGSSHWHIITQHLLPGCYSHIIVISTLAIPSMILGETALSFLGLGIRPPMTSWGVLLEESQRVTVLLHYPWLLFPAIPVLIVVISFNFLGDDLRGCVKSTINFDRQIKIYGTWAFKRLLTHPLRRFTNLLSLFPKLVFTDRCVPYQDTNGHQFHHRKRVWLFALVQQSCNSTLGQPTAAGQLPLGGKEGNFSTRSRLTR